MKCRIMAAVALAAAPGAAAAQGAGWGDRCATGALAGECTARLLTNFGGYVIGPTSNGGGGHFRVVADWGVIGPIGRKAAAGATFFASIDDDGLIAGPALRFRRVVGGGKAALEVSLGMPLLHSNDYQLRTPFAMIKINPTPRYGMALRPEIRRRREFDCDPEPPYHCAESIRTVGTASAEVEFDGLPGVLLTGATTVAVLALLSIVANSD